MSDLDIKNNILTMHFRPAAFLLSLLCFPVSSAAATKKEPLKVVYSGFGRSGTHSLRAALQRLGYHTCHGEDIGRDILYDANPELADAFINADFDAIVDETEKLGYNATLDIHGKSFYGMKLKCGLCICF